MLSFTGELNKRWETSLFMDQSIDQIAFVMGDDVEGFKGMFCMINVGGN